MVEAGDTFRDVPVTVPMSGLIDRLSALAVLQLRVEDLPLSMVDGLALKLLIVGAGFGGAWPVTLTLSSSLPCTRFA